MSVSPSQHSAAPASTAPASTVPASAAPAAAVAVYWTQSGALDGDAAARLCAELPAEERERARRFAFAADRALFVAAHVLLRRVLRARLGGAEPVIVADPFGRPELAPGPAGAMPLSFNLTHTSGFAACAVSESEGVRVGIDAENTRRPLAFAEIAARWYAAAEQRLLARLPAARRAEMFFRIWTLKEAILKAGGVGLRLDTRRFSVDPERGRAAVPPGLGIAAEWRLAELAPLPHIRLALAIPGRGPLALAVTQVGPL